MKSFVVVSGLLVIGLSGCSHGAMRGSVAMKTTDREAHVCIDKNQAKPGHQVRLFRNKCTKGSAKLADTSVCEKVYLGSGIVKENLNEHYSLVQFDEGVAFEEGSFVETF